MINYNNLSFSNSEPPVDEKIVSRTEKKLKCQFPPDYRDFLLKVNGGVPSTCEYHTEQWGPLCIDCFYGITRTRDSSDLIYEQDDDDLATGFLNIGFDPGSAPYYLVISGEETGNVYLRDTGLMDEDGEPALYLITTSFREFLQILSRATPRRPRTAANAPPPDNTPSESAAPEKPAPKASKKRRK
ncbi:SMI1/KNR4 family protein [Fimbriiglobus ruber]|uniref:Knr4/Smi1-like domain-containing protein n=1 Tax=Fimbriiglobus ruber TaxID=1908690 RepID=A0A225E6X2_9BACT|nr:SMI1/KNR4 family protein [Fimbriiglobus ruber]OWK44415.1 hypothetical protein FRUB_02347 [Fimbriiglobus ruber]